LAPVKYGQPAQRTDIYQMGMIFYELVTGKLPFEGRDLSLLMSQIIHQRPERPSRIVPSVEMLDRVIMKCLEKEMARRYHTVLEFQKALRPFLHRD